MKKSKGSSREDDDQVVCDSECQRQLDAGESTEEEEEKEDQRGENSRFKPENKETDSQTKQKEEENDK